jgi:hypothetical protein
MTTKKGLRSELYGTSQVAEILGIPEWRVKNFSEGVAYRLPPTHQVGTGRGSRRLYGWEDIFRIALADHLVACGFTPEAVGRAVREVPESALGPYLKMLQLDNPEQGRLPKRDTPMLLSVAGAWHVVKASEASREVRKTLAHTESAKGLFVMNLATFCDRVFNQLQRYWGK